MKKISNAIEVTVFCLAYNHEKYIKKTLDSILSQKTTFNFEIIVNDDASTDNTTNILKEYQKKYPDIIKPIFHKENEGSKHQIKTYDKILKYAKGKYIALCECDDFWLDINKLQVQYDALNSDPIISLCFCRTLKVSESGDSLNIYAGDFGNNRSIISSENIISGDGGVMGTNSIMIRKKVYSGIKQFYEEFGPQPVGDFIIQSIGSFPNGALYLPYTFSAYRINSKGSWSSKMKDITFSYNFKLRGIKMFKSMDIYFDNEYSRAFKNLIASRVVDICRSQIKIEDKQKVFSQEKDNLNFKQLILCPILKTKFGYLCYQILREIYHSLRNFLR